MSLPQVKVSDLSQPTPQNLEKWWAILGLSIGFFLFALDVYVVNLALPTMVDSLHTSFAHIQWVVISYLLAIVVFVLSAAKLGDMFSKKRLYIMGLIVFTISSLLCGLSTTLGWLITFRFLQGVGAAFLSGLGTAIIVEVFPAEQRGLGFGIRAAVFGMGIMVGPTVGGLLISLGGWPLIFWINIPLGLIGILIVACLVPPSAVSHTKHNFDAIGTLILSLCLICFTLSLTVFQTQVSNWVITLALLGGSALSLVGFIWRETHHHEPMLDLKIFRSLAFSLGLLLRFLGNFVIAGVIFILPFFFELVNHYSTEKSGLLLVIPSIVTVVSAPIAGILADRFGARNINLIGLVLMAVGCGCISTFDSQLTIGQYVIGIIPYGLGVGLFETPNSSMIMGAAPPEQLGVASGLLSLVRILGQLVGVPLVGTLVAWITIHSTPMLQPIDVTHVSPASLITGIHTTFHLIVTVLIATVLLTFGLESQPEHEINPDISARA